MKETPLNVARPCIANYRAGKRWTLVGLLMSTLVIAGGGSGGWTKAEGSHNTCGLVAQVPGGETQVETWASTNLNNRLPMTFSGKVRVGTTPWGDPIKVNVDATIKKPAKNVDIVCIPSSFSSRFDLTVRVSGRLGSDTHSGDGRIAGHYTVSSISPPRVCVGSLGLAGFNLHGVQNDVDNWIRKKINASGLIGPFCVP